MSENKMTSSQFIERCEEGKRLGNIILSQIFPRVYPAKRHWKKIDPPELPPLEPWPLLEPPEGYIVGRTTERKHIEDTERWFRTCKDLKRNLEHYMNKPGRKGVRRLEQTFNLSKETGYSVLCTLYEEYYDWPYDEFIQILLPEWLEGVREQA